MIDILEVAIEFKLINLMSHELTNITKQMFGLDKTTLQTIKNMGAFKMAVVGVGAVAFGAGILIGMEKIAEKGSELTKQLGQLQMQYADISDAQINQARQYAIGASIKSAFPVTPAETVAGISENFTIFKDWKEAMAMTDTTNMIKGAIASALGKTFDAADSDYKNLIKSVELHGDTLDPLTHQFSVERTIAALEDKERLMVATRGMATSNDILQVEKQGAVVLRAMDFQKADRFVAGLIQAFGGSRAGTAIQAFGQQFYGGKMSEVNAMEMERLGLLAQNGFTKRKGGGVNINSGAFTGQTLLDKGDVMKYFETVMIPALHGAYLKEKRPGESEAAFNAAELGKMIGTATDRRLINEMASQLTALKKEGAGIDQTQTPEQQIATAKLTNLDIAKQGLGTAIESLFQVVGSEGATQAAIWGLNQLTGAIKFLTTEAQAHPEVVKFLSYAAIGVGVFAVVAGGIAAIVGAIGLFFAIPYAAGIVAFTALTAGLGAGIAAILIYRDKIKGVIKGWETDVEHLGTSFKLSMKHFYHHSIEPIGTNIKAALENTWIIAKNAFDNFLGNFASYFKNFFTNFLANNLPNGSANMFHKESYRVPEATSNKGGMQTINLIVDGKKMSTVVANHLTNTLNQNSTGPTSFNGRQNMSQPGFI